MEIKVKLFPGQIEFKNFQKGDWIDLRANADIDIEGPHSARGAVSFQTYKIPLGVAMQLPEGYEAIMAPRSSTYPSYGVIAWNSIGVIDNSYCGDNDEWKFPVIGFEKKHIAKGQRVCQFRIQLSQKATIWQKIKWLFGFRPKFKYVETLDNDDRGGFGKSGK